jgi:DNA-binding transcriptional ArsR family regulator
MIAYLASNEGTGKECIGMTCGQFLDLGSKTSLSYHLAKLREAGVVNVRPEGTKRIITLRRDDLDSRFPGFLDSIIASAIYPSLTLRGDTLHGEAEAAGWNG